MLQVPLSIFLLLLWKHDGALGIRIVELRVPTHEREGGMALLGCQYDMEGERLYSVKWYKDGDEFFRYSPIDEPNMMYFNRADVIVDLSRSSSTEVALVHLTQKSSGIYRCEIFGEAPRFQIAAIEKEIDIQLLPQSGPRVTGGREKYSLNDLVVMNCSSPASRPEAHLKWLINDKPVSREHIYGPWRKKPTDRDDAVEVTSQLRFYAVASDFVDGIMRIKCQSTIAPMYQRETISEHGLALPYLDEGFIPNVAGFITDGVDLSRQLSPLLYVITLVISI